MLFKINIYHNAKLCFWGLLIFLCPLVSSSQAPVSGTVGFPSVSSTFNSVNQLISTYGCTPSSVEGPLANVNVTMLKIATSTTASGTTNASGFYSFTFPSTGLVSNTPVYAVNDTFFNVSTFDIAIISKHLLKIDPIACPYRRIAADLDFNGKIDTADMEKLRRLILRKETASWPIYRFMSKAYALPAKKHPDPQFLADFWSTDYTDADGNQYPFNAKFRYNNKTYTYNGAQKWVGLLNEWQLPSDSCLSSSNWGFVAIKMGDMNGNNGVVPFNSSPVVSLQNNSSDNNNFVKSNASSGKLSKNKEYRINLRATSEQAIGSFQIQLRGESSKMEILTPDSYNGGLQLNPSRDVYTDKNNKGQIRVVWLCDFNQFKEGIKLTDTPIFSIIIKVKDDTDLTSFTLDSKDFLNCFFGNNGEAVKTDIRMEVEESQ